MKLYILILSNLLIINDIFGLKNHSESLLTDNVNTTSWKSTKEPSIRSRKGRKPNIILILADDLGFNDVSFRGQNFFLTPNIDALAYHGTILNKYYVPSVCTPSRTALLTGKYPLRTGMQHLVIPNGEPWGLCANEKLMSHIFQEAGYSTNIIGKWHLGFFKESYTPTYRGFDYHYGYMGGYIDYWTHSLKPSNSCYSPGHDLWKNTEQVYDKNGTYATDIITNEAINVIRNHNVNEKPLFLIINHLAPHTGDEDDPMQAPKDEIDKFTHITDLNKRTYAAMVSKLDESIGKTIHALKNKNMLENSIVIFYSDNGAPTVGMFSNGGSNFPLRGQKFSPWEGGVRSSGVIWSPLLNVQSTIWNEYIHAIDWLPTLLDAANIPIPNEYQIDGRNLWKSISNGESIDERSILHNIDEILGYSSYMRGIYKYINGTTNEGVYDSWLSDVEYEKDPRSYNYSKTIINTQTWKILQNFNKNNIDTNKIEKIRSQLSIKCNLRKKISNNSTFECEPLKAPCLFNIKSDPCEMYNLAKLPKYQGILESMKNDVEEWKNKLIPSVRQDYFDPISDPALHNGEWRWWKDQSDGNSIPGTYCI
ncbi:arylsulfatase B-like [Condylostylus longicornis]|uniref:arylsulfatase B-like n=1 Tax=Condylostylus longicornis TaxID=2530218 RepID=UPI00244DF810|nr:arylsulfatase B-like [Condylostylus longicornis]